MSSPFAPDDDTMFYLYPFNPKTGKPDRLKVVASKYLVVNGSKIVDPAAKGSNQVNLYGSLNPDGTINETSQFQNTNNYLIIPADYNPSEAIAFAAKVNGVTALGSAENPAIGLAYSLGLMIKNFLPGGGQDLQRGRKWGVPDGEVAPAFKDAASWNLGYITDLTAVPNVFAQIGGGALNIWEYKKDKKDHKIPTRPFGMDEADAKNFTEGVRSAQTSAGRGLREIYDNMLVIGRWAHDSIAPIKGRSRQQRLLHRPGKHASINETAPSVFGRKNSADAEFGTARGAGLLASEAPHKVLQLFRQIGEHIRTGAMMAPELHVPALAHERKAALLSRIRDAGKIGAMFTSNYQYISAMDAPNPLETHMSPNAMDKVGLTSHVALPSIAPAGRRENKETAAEHLASRNLDMGLQANEHRTAPALEANRNMGHRQLHGALNELLNRAARRPPNGTSAFDPRLTPAWAGLKLPA